MLRLLLRRNLSKSCASNILLLIMNYLNYGSWAAIKAAKLAGPSAPGSKTIPDAAAPDCLSGLSFVFTGELSSLSRDEATDLAKRFGG